MTIYGEGSLYFNKARGAWELAHMIDGKRYIERVTKRDRTDASCKTECRLRRQQRRAGIEASAGLGPSSMAWLAKEWLAVECKGLAAGTLRSYGCIVDTIITHLGTIESDELELHDIQRMLVALADGGKRPATIGKVRSVLSSICDTGVAWRKMRSNPVKSLRRTPKGEATTKGHRWYDVEQYATALDYIVDPDNHDQPVAIVAVMLMAGLRSQEVRALRWEHIDWRKATLRIAEAVKATSEVVGVPKSKSGYRVVPMAPELTAVLRRQAERQMAEGRSGYVFPRGGTFLTHDDITAAATAFARQAGLDYVNPHGFRHTFASIALHRGMGYEVLAKLMGHADVSQLIKTYGHVVVDTETLDMSRFVGVAGGRREAM